MKRQLLRARISADPGPRLLMIAMLAGLASSGGCRRLAARPDPAAVTVWVLPAHGDAGRDSVMPAGAAGRFAIGDGITIDTSSLRPVRAERGQRDSLSAHHGLFANRAVVVSTFQGSDHHPETFRALAGDSVVMRAAAGLIYREAAMLGSSVILLDFQDLTGKDVRDFHDFVRAVSDSSASLGARRVGLILPPSDTIAYPTASLARVAWWLQLRLYGEHRPGTPPGPLASSNWISRQIGLRAVAVGVNRLVAEFPLFGYLWEADGTGRPITFSEARQLVATESGSFRRDPASEFLTATGRDGWTIWIPDGTTVGAMIAAARKSGITTFALTGLAGAAPQILDGVPAQVRR